MMTSFRCQFRVGPDHRLGSRSWPLDTAYHVERVTLCLHPYAVARASHNLCHGVGSLDYTNG